jgi:hypothetical protein
LQGHRKTPYIKKTDEEILRRINILTQLFNSGLNKTDILRDYSDEISSSWFKLIDKFNIVEYNYCDCCGTTENLKINNKNKISNICKNCFSTKMVSSKKNKIYIKKEIEIKESICPTCGKVFQSKNSTYCSYHCRPSTKTPLKTCIHCGKTYKGASSYLCNDCYQITVSCKCGCGGSIPLKKYLIQNVRYIYGHHKDIVIKNNKNKIVSKIELEKRLQNKRPEIKILSSFENLKDIILCTDINCGHIWETKISYLLNGSGCHICKNSRGEKQIEDFLNSRNIEFKRQYIFKDCKDKRTLPFDFYLPEFNMCIEYDGEGHYESIKLWGGDEGLKQRQERDKIKTDYCNKNNILLYRIPYWAKDDIYSSLMMITTLFRVKKLPEKVIDKIEQLWGQVKEEFKNEEIPATI